MNSDSAREPQAATNSPWPCLESIPGPSAVSAVWREKLGSKYENFKSAFLRSAPAHLAQFIPCPVWCGCWHEVIRRDDGSLGAECRCEPRRCDTFTVTKEDITPWELDWSRVGRALCGALGVNPKSGRLGLYNTVQIGCWSEDAVPVILTIQSHHREFLHVVSALVARVGKPFILFAPTGQQLGVAARELLETAGAVFLSLDAHAVFTEDGNLRSAQAPGELFAQVVPGLKEPEEEDVARRALALIDRLESECPMNAPSVSAVFRLYCIEELTMARIARKCRCSIGTVANRLKLIRVKTGVEAKDLRRVSGHLDRTLEDGAAAKAGYVKRSRGARSIG